jgi:antibiotic biosynthesis monooxygenase (ABM) superfamily enzyme
MYGTVARMRIRAGAEAQFQQITDEISAQRVPGHVGIVVYQMDSDAREFYLAIVFESREAYHANANSPEQHERFLKLMSALEAEPEWHDGEIVHHDL